MGKKIAGGVVMTRDELVEFFKNRADYHVDMMRMFRKTASSSCWGYKGHLRGYLIADEHMKSIKNGKTLSNHVLANYLGRGVRIIEDKEE